MNPLDKRPEALTDQSNPEALIVQLRTMSTLDARQKHRLDFALTHWTQQLVSRPFDLEGVLEMQDLCSLAQSLLDKSMDAELYARWEGFTDVLEAKRLAIRSRSSSRRMELLQEGDILTRLQRDGQVSQSELANQLQLSPGRVSQVLAIMESRDQITRKKLGKENWVTLPPVAVTPESANVVMQDRARYTVNPAKLQTEPQQYGAGAIFFTNLQAA